jgi:hypothetical protein
MNVLIFTFPGVYDSSRSCIYGGSLIKRSTKGRWMPVRRRAPFPAMLRRVSGRKKMIAIMVKEERMSKNTNIDL